MKKYNIDNVTQQKRNRLYLVIELFTLVGDYTSCSSCRCMALISKSSTKAFTTLAGIPIFSKSSRVSGLLRFARPQKSLAFCHGQSQPESAFLKSCFVQIHGEVSSNKNFLKNK